MILSNSELKALVNETDFIYISFYSWNLTKDGYARCNNFSHMKNQYLHLIIAERMKLSGLMVDHQDRNRLNCCRTNLRTATESQNHTNSFHPTTSGYKGVSWHAKYHKWRVTVTVNGRGRHVGYYDDPVVAAREYDRQAKYHHGEFAFLNFPE